MLVTSALLALLSLLQGCAAPSPAERAAAAERLAAAHGWLSLQLAGGPFDLQAFVPAVGGGPPPQRLTVYIEGDGLAWLDASTPSLAPTPGDPVALRLAMAHAGGPAAYLGRPCQYTQGAALRHCHPRYWTSHRFAPEVMDAMDRAVQQLQHRSGATELVLVGYSGGAAVAAHLAARRSDVAAWVTVAGTLDTDAWTRTLGLSPLHGSLNPVRVAAALSRIPQWHFTGSDDRVVPPRLLHGFLQAQARGGSRDAVAPTVQRMDGFDHVCCWAREWPRLSRLFSQPDTSHSPGADPVGPVSDTTR